MSIIVIAVATDSGVPIFTRKRGTNENIQFSTIASMHGINMFSKCHNLSMINSQVDNGIILWKEYCKSITLIGIATGGLECDLELLLSCVHDLMLFYIGKKELETLKNIDQIKRELRQCYPILDHMLESLDPNAVSSPFPTLVLDLIQSILCPQAQQLQDLQHLLLECVRNQNQRTALMSEHNLHRQAVGIMQSILSNPNSELAMDVYRLVDSAQSSAQALDFYAESVTGRWACLSIHGHLIATSSDFHELDPREARLLLLLTVAQNGAPLRDTPVYLPYMSPNLAFRAVTCKLLADVYILVICGATPLLSQIDEIVLQCWEGYTQIIKEAKLTYPKNFPTSIVFEPCILAVMVINVSKKRCVFSRHLHPTSQKSRGMSGVHRMDILRTFYITSARDLAPELKAKTDGYDEGLADMTETYWCSEYHKCNAQRIGNLLCCVLYASTVQMHTIRMITNKLLQDLIACKEIHW